MDEKREVLDWPRSMAHASPRAAKSPDTAFPPIEPLRPREGAPNVLVILLDDAGFGSSSAFGGPCQTPNFERLAANGLKYNRFHTTALCSPTRQALLTGRNHHAVGMGSITEIAASAPGYSSVRPNAAAPLAETLKLNGYSTAQFGKCHEVPVWETSPMGPFDAWPTGGGGFEHFYGFVGGETNQYSPAIYQDTVPIEPDRTPEEGYHFTEDMTDRAIEWAGAEGADARQAVLRLRLSAPFGASCDKTKEDSAVAAHCRFGPNARSCVRGEGEKRWTRRHSTATRRRSGEDSCGAWLSSRGSALPIPGQWSWQAPESTSQRRASSLPAAVRLRRPRGFCSRRGPAKPRQWPECGEDRPTDKEASG
jgi:Sulfatase